MWPAGGAAAAAARAEADWRPGGECPPALAGPSGGCEAAEAVHNKGGKRISYVAHHSCLEAESEGYETGVYSGLCHNAGPRLCECQAKMVIKSRTKIHQTWDPPHSHLIAVLNKKY